VRVLKICGITRAEDALAAAAYGATSVGFVFWPQSPRYVEPAAAAEIVAALPTGIDAVGVFVNAGADAIIETAERAGVTRVQLHGEEGVAVASRMRWPIFRSATLESAARLRATWPADTVLVLDADDPVRRGGTGRAVDWARAGVVAREGRVVLAGGLTAENVARAVTTVRPIGVDVSSGVEDALGVKSTEKMARFLENARRAFEER
jgi:phosphoribosylanthranilate isomerase